MLSNLLNFTALLGPFGLAFPAETLATETLSCETLRGRPFVTALSVQHLHAPLGGRDAYEFRITCGPSHSAWSDLGPPLLWASSKQGTAICPRPASARGLLVNRGRSESARADHYSFSLMCGGSAELVDADGLGGGDDTAESRGRACPEGSFIAGLDVSRGFEPRGAYDLYEFTLHCAEIMEDEPVPPPTGFDTRSFSAPAREAGGTAGPRGGSRDSRAGGGEEEAEAAEMAAAAAAAAQDPRERFGQRRGGPAKTAPVIGRGKGAAEALEPSAEASAEGGAAAGRGEAAGLRGSELDELELLQRLLQGQRKQQAQVAGAAQGAQAAAMGAAGGAATDEEGQRVRSTMAKLEQAGVDAMFGRVRESGTKAEAAEAEAAEAEAAAAEAAAAEAAAAAAAARERTSRERAAREARIKLARAKQKDSDWEAEWEAEDAREKEWKAGGVREAEMMATGEEYRAAAKEEAAAAAPMATAEADAGVGAVEAQAEAAEAAEPEEAEPEDAEAAEPEEAEEAEPEEAEEVEEAAVEAAEEGAEEAEEEGAEEAEQASELDDDELVVEDAEDAPEAGQAVGQAAA